MNVVQTDMNVFHQELAEKIRTSRAVVGICGLGYVGLPLARAIAAAGFRIIGFDIDPAKVEDLNAGRSYIQHIASQSIRDLLDRGLFKATTDFAEMSEVDIVLICVPTPLTKQREPDLSYVTGTAASVARFARPGQLLESTTYPGTTREVVKPLFEEKGLVSGETLFLAFSPEREDPGNSDYETAMIPKVVGAEDRLALDLATSFYSRLVVQVVPVSSLGTAEAVKLTENIFRAVNIALVNELKLIYSAMGIDIWEVIEAAKTKPFGFMAFYPGPGLGGHCIPIDPFYLTWKAREYEIVTHFIELAGQINSAMPRHVVDRLAEAVDRKLRRGLNGSRVLILGVAYKKNVADIRESSSLKLIKLLEERGADVDYHDPHVEIIPHTREDSALAGRRSVALTPESLASYDAVLIATDHDRVDYCMVVDSSQIVVDTRNVCERVGVKRENVVKA